MPPLFTGNTCKALVVAILGCLTRRIMWRTIAQVIGIAFSRACGGYPPLFNEEISPLGVSYIAQYAKKHGHLRSMLSKTWIRYGRKSRRTRRLQCQYCKSGRQKARAECRPKLAGTDLQCSLLVPFRERMPSQQLLLYSVLTVRGNVSLTFQQFHVALSAGRVCITTGKKRGIAPPRVRMAILFTVSP
ncbi:hypothetical protein KCP73_10915 [Salmonella enterica subsp. enterica]|nr:hypothetical protein KCP73_10915 [Salmonella enterica subsp. enterica]